MDIDIKMLIVPLLLFIGGAIAGRLSDGDIRTIAIRVWVISLIFTFIEVALDLIQLKLYMVFVLPLVMTSLFISGVLIVRVVVRFPIILFYIMLTIFLLSYKFKILPR